MAYTAQQLKESIERLFGDIDVCITDLIRAVLKGADVIETPSEDELRGFVKGVGKVSEETAYVLMKYYRWLKSKIVK